MNIALVFSKAVWMRMDISTKKGAMKMTFFIRCAAILQNLLLSDVDDWDTALYEFGETAEFDATDSADEGTTQEENVVTQDMNEIRENISIQIWEN
ncbi:unnamed protein product, partial [Aphanomyces euteiches]